MSLDKGGVPRRDVLAGIAATGAAALSGGRVLGGNEKAALTIEAAILKERTELPEPKELRQMVEYVRLMCGEHGPYFSVLSARTAEEVPAISGMPALRSADERIDHVLRVASAVSRHLTNAYAQKERYAELGSLFNLPHIEEGSCDVRVATKQGNVIDLEGALMNVEGTAVLATARHVLTVPGREPELLHLMRGNRSCTLDARHIQYPAEQNLDYAMLRLSPADCARLGISPEKLPKLDTEKTGVTYGSVVVNRIRKSRDTAVPGVFFSFELPWGEYMKRTRDRAGMHASVYLDSASSVMLKDPVQGKVSRDDSSRIVASGTSGSPLFVVDEGGCRVRGISTNMQVISRARSWPYGLSVFPSLTPFAKLARLVAGKLQM